VNRRWENDGIFVSKSARVVKLIEYESTAFVGEYVPALLEDQQTGERFYARDADDTHVAEQSFCEMEILALIASGEPVKLDKIYY